MLTKTLNKSKVLTRLLFSSLCFAVIIRLGIVGVVFGGISMLANALLLGSYGSVSQYRSSVMCLNKECFCWGTIGQIVTSWKFDALNTSIIALEASLLGQIFVLRTSNFQGATIKPIVPRHKHSIAFSVHHKIWIRKQTKTHWIQFQIVYFLLRPLV